MIVTRSIDRAFTCQAAGSSSPVHLSPRSAEQLPAVEHVITEDRGDGDIFASMFYSTPPKGGCTPEEVETAGAFSSVPMASASTAPATRSERRNVRNPYAHCAGTPDMHKTTKVSGKSNDIPQHVSYLDVYTHAVDQPPS